MKKTNKRHEEILSFHTFAFIGIFVFLALLVYVLNFGGAFFKTSVVSFPEHASFNGTTYPVKKVPNWVKLSSEKWTANYSELSGDDLVNIPAYNPNELVTPVENLKWGNSADDAVRIAKITYSVPYMGNYKLDGKEYAGSHLAVDIKIPTGTPIYAIANGTVIKASTQSSGFGHHIVLLHNNFPELNDSKKKNTLYSSYSHLSDVFVSVGDVVKKGQQIGLSGATGTATTPHLHFQIDNDEADWHPFWPFTSSEAYSAGLDFFSAINAGLGKDIALETTVNPMKYVQKYLNYTSAGSYVEDEDGGDDDDDDTQSNTEDDEDDYELTFVIETSPQYYFGQEPIFTIYMKNQYGNTFDKRFSGSIKLSAVRNSFEVVDDSLSYKDFDDGKTLNSMEALSKGRDRIKLEYDDQLFYSDWFDVIDPEDEDAQLFSDVPVGSRYAEATKYLAMEGVINGYPDGTFKPEQTVTRAEALKLIYEAGDVRLSSGSLPFDDTDKSAWYGKYVYTAYKNDVVKGYKDGSFKPENTVIKSEFFKMLCLGLDSKVKMNPKTSPFKDVEVDDWFAPYIVHAADIGIVNSEATYFNPSAGMSRGEIAEVLYKMMTAKNS